MKRPVWKWFEQRSFHCRDFYGLAYGEGPDNRPTTTLIRPTRNVATTLGSILRTVSMLNERSGLIDQVIVVDADSTDGTQQIARAWGAETYSENELLPCYGPAQGSAYGPCQGKGNS